MKHYPKKMFSFLCLMALVLQPLQFELSSLFENFQVKTNVAHAAPSDNFVITIKTDNPGTSNSTSFTIPQFSGVYDVDWNNDGTFDQLGLNTPVTNDFGVAGTYTIRIQGLTRLAFSNGGDKDKLLSIDQWGTAAWLNMSNAFQGCTNLEVNATDTPDLSNVTDLSFMFSGATSFTGTNTPMNSWNTSNIQTTSGMFLGATSFNAPINNWDTSNITVINGMFRNASSFNQDLDNWFNSPSNLINAQEVFYDATNFNGDVSTWDMDQVVDMRNFFRSAIAFQGDLSSWRVNSSTSISFMFFGLPNFNSDISSWGTTTGNIQSIRGAFRGATSFNQDIGNWDTSSIELCDQIFYGATAFNQDISGWDVSGCTTFENMFRGATSFNQDIGGWTTSSVIDLDGTFRGATAFDQDISGWDVEDVTAAVFMFNGVKLSTTNYDALLAGWDAQNLNAGVTFDGGLSNYCNSSTERANMIASDTWVITDDGIDCDPVITFTAPNKVSSAAITNTTIRVTDDSGVLATNVSINTSNTTGAFSISSVSCSQTSATQVDCTLQIDANEGTGDLSVSATDDGGNIASSTESGYIIDSTAPSTPASAPDMQAASDSGSSSIDNFTQSTTQNYNVVCTEVGSTITIKVGGIARGTHVCTAVATESVLLTPALTDGDYVITYSETDVAGNESGDSPALNITVDTTNADPTLTTPIEGDNTVDQTEATTVLIEGTAEDDSTIQINFDDGVNPIITTSIVTSITGDYTLLGSEVDISSLNDGNITVTVISTDVSGNVSNPVSVIITKSTISTTTRSSNGSGSSKNFSNPFGSNKSIQNENIVRPTLEIFLSSQPKEVQEVMSSLGNKTIKSCIEINNEKIVSFTDKNILPEYVKNLTQAKINGGVKEYIVEGNSDKTIALEKVSNRTEMTKLILISHCLPIFDEANLPLQTINGNPMPNFPDLVRGGNSDQWVRDVMYSAAFYEVIKGYDDGLVRPNKNISKAEYLAVLSRVSEITILEEIKQSSLNTIKDQWFTPYIGKLLTEKIITLDDLNSLEKDISRDDSFFFINTTLNQRSLYKN